MYRVFTEMLPSGVNPALASDYLTTGNVLTIISLACTCMKRHTTTSDGENVLVGGFVNNTHSYCSCS